jgi:hypothetical protein
MVRTWFQGQAQLRAEKSGPQFRDQFFRRISSGGEVGCGGEW